MDSQNPLILKKQAFSLPIYADRPSQTSFPIVFDADHDVIWYGYGIIIWSMWVSCPRCVPYQLLAHPQPTC